MNYCFSLSFQGFVTDNGRVCGTLGLARAIGDSVFQPMVTCVPDVVVAPLDGVPSCLVIACDGVWDVIDRPAAWCVISVILFLSLSRVCCYCKIFYKIIIYIFCRSIVSKEKCPTRAALVNKWQTRFLLLAILDSIFNHI